MMFMHQNRTSFRRLLSFTFLFTGLLLCGSMLKAAPRNPVQDQIFAARDKVLPALVHIQPVVRDFATGQLKKQSQIGSGVIFHPDGYVVTNYHVAGKAERIICTLNDKEQVTATYIGGDPATDLAVVKLDLSKYKKKIRVASFGNSDSVQVGQQVLAMGSPLSLSRSVSSGVISTRDRYFSSDIRLPTGELTGRFNLWLQTDAAINPGNSGGPLVNLAGEVIGINSRAAFLANNIGFAIPINVVKSVTEELLRHQKVSRSWIGVEIQALQELENYFGTDDSSGVLIASVDPDSPAEEAGLQAGDIIRTVDTRAVSARYYEELPAFYNDIARRPSGVPIQLQIRRQSDSMQLSVLPRELGSQISDDFECEAWEFTVKNITQPLRMDTQLKDSLGVYVAGVKSVGIADRAGLQRGDVIVSVDRQPVTTLDSFTALYQAAADQKKKRILLTVHRGNAVRIAVLATDRKSSADAGKGKS